MLCGPEAVMSPSYQCCPGFGHRVVRSSEPSSGGTEDFSMAVLSSSWPGTSRSGSLILDSIRACHHLSFSYLFLVGRVHCTTRHAGFLVLQTGIQPHAPALGAQSL